MTIDNDVPGTRSQSSAVPEGAGLIDWVAAGLISPQQAQQIAAWEAARRAGTAPQKTASRQSTLIEALAYVGGAVIAAALLIVMFGYFDQMSQATQIALPAIAAGVLLAAGALIPQRLGPLGIRMRAALWFAAVIAVAGLMTVIAGVTEMDAPAAPRWGAGVATLVAAILWILHRVTAQHVAAFVALNGLVAALINQDGLVTGLVLTALAALWAVLSMFRLLPGQGRWLSSQLGQPDAHQLWGIRMAAVGAGVAGIVIAASWESSVVGLVPILAIITVAVVLTDVSLVSIGAAAGLIVIPMIADHYFNSTLATALVLLIAGGLLVTLAILIARRRSSRESAAAQPANADGVPVAS